jgi:hypothetical protein
MTRFDQKKVLLYSDLLFKDIFVKKMSVAIFMQNAACCKEYCETIMTLKSAAVLKMNSLSVKGYTMLAFPDAS